MNVIRQVSCGSHGFSSQCVLLFAPFDVFDMQMYLLLVSLFVDVSLKCVKLAE